MTQMMYNLDKISDNVKYLHDSFNHITYQSDKTNGFSTDTCRTPALKIFLRVMWVGWGDFFPVYSRRERGCCCACVVYLFIITLNTSI